MENADEENGNIEENVNVQDDIPKRAKQQEGNLRSINKKRFYKENVFMILRSLFRSLTAFFATK